MVLVDTGSDDGSWAGYIADMESIGRLKVIGGEKPSVDKLLQTIADLEQKLQKAEKHIRKLERANELLAQMVV